jgi:pyrroline-5-carboxylate reductase
VRLSQAIPLPFVARRKGVTAIYPPDPATAAFFNVLGNVECETKTEFDLLAAASALMATYFGIMHHTTKWLAEKGLPEEKAAPISHFFPVPGGDWTWARTGPADHRRTR